MSLYSLGVDVATTKLAFAGLDRDGHIRTWTAAIDKTSRGAQRLRLCRDATIAAVQQLGQPCIAVVEIPWARSGSSFALLSIAGVCLEAVQHAAPGAVIFDVPTHTWKIETVGKGNASKADALAHAQALGLDSNDQDLADALCMAQTGWERWTRWERDNAA